jgi:capsule polysaccharide export protein KpsC/LpsZ
LRWPRPTAYLDFSGVNGNTEAARRYLASGCEPAGSPLSIESMRRFFLREDDGATPAKRFRLGVALQVEDDSNLLAFGRGFDNLSLLTVAHLRHPEGSVLARGHPGSVFALKPDWYALDGSPDSLTFIRRCEEILTINSSVGLEALLMQTPVEILGDCAHRYIAEADDKTERTARLAFYLFAYLVPMQSIYDPGYLRFRLGQPTEYEIAVRHLAAYGLDSERLRRDAAGSLSRLLELALSDAVA